MNLSVKNVKTFRGTEGEGYSADLYLDGKKVAYVVDAAHGGEVELLLVKGTTPEAWQDLTTRLYEYPKTLPRLVFPECPKGLEQTLGIVVGNLVSDYQLKQAYKRECKKYTLYRNPEQPLGEYYRITRPYSPEIKATILSKNPKAEIINERFL